MKNKKIIIGSRGSKLALIYAERAKARILEFCSDYEVKEVDINFNMEVKASSAASNA